MFSFCGKGLGSLLRAEGLSSVDLCSLGFGSRIPEAAGSVFSHLIGQWSLR